MTGKRNEMTKRSERTQYAAEFTDDDRDTTMRLRHDRAEARSEAREAIAEGVEAYEATRDAYDAQKAARDDEWERAVYYDDATGGTVGEFS